MINKVIFFKIVKYTELWKQTKYHDRVDEILNRSVRQ